MALAKVHKYEPKRSCESPPATPSWWKRCLVQAPRSIRRSSSSLRSTPGILRNSSLYSDLLGHRLSVQMTQRAFWSQVSHVTIVVKVAQVDQVASCSGAHQAPPYPGPLSYISLAALKLQKKSSAIKPYVFSASRSKARSRFHCYWRTS